MPSRWKKVTGGILTQATEKLPPSFVLSHRLSDDVADAAFADEELVDTPEMNVAYRAVKESAYWRT
jgi:hypothetical protein